VQLPFAPIPDEFTVASFAQRQELYWKLCQLIWDPANLGIEAPSHVDRPTTEERQQRYYGVTVKDLLAAGLLRQGQQLVGGRNGSSCSAIVRGDGRIQLEDGRVEESPSKAGAAALGVKACNGWHFWQTDTPRGLVRLSRVRDDYLERQRHQ
jgi:hypothetical protein